MKYKIFLLLLPFVFIGMVRTNAATLTIKAGGCSEANIWSDLSSGATVTVTAIPQEGYRFTQWSDNNTDNPRTFTVTEDVTYTAQFELIPTFGLTLKTQTIGEEACLKENTITGLYTNDKVNVSAFNLEGYRFKRWVETNETSPNMVVTIGSENVTYTAEFEIIPTYSLTLKAQTIGQQVCEEVNTISGIYPNDIVEISAIPQGEYQFLYWADDETNTSNPRSITMGEADQDFTAVFSGPEPTYTLSVVADGCEQSPNTYKDLKDGATVTLTALPQTGYRFKQWKETSDTNAEIEVTINNADATYTAEFEEIPTYTLTINAQTEGSAACANVSTFSSLYAGDKVVVTANPLNSNYLFDHWSDNNTDNPRTFNATEDATYIAIFSPVKYTLTWDFDGGQTSSTEYTQGQVAVGTTIVAPANPTKEGYTFTNWDKVIAATMPNEDVTYTAQYTINQHTITWVTDGDPLTGDYTTGKVNYGTAIVAPNTPTKTGYVFKAWSPAVDATMPDHDVTYTATWTSATKELFDNVQPGQTVSEAKTIMENSLSAWNGQTIDLIIHRTIWRDGYYNTLCLPFAMDADMWSDTENNPLYGGQLMKYTGATVEDNTVWLNIEETNSIEAGKPYLVRFEEGENIVDPLFKNVVIDNTATTVQPASGMNFHATYCPTILDIGNKGILFVGSNNGLYWPATNNPLRGFRAYFTINDSPVGAQIRKNMDAKLIVNSPTNISEMEGKNEVNKVLVGSSIMIIRNGKYYNLTGTQIK